MDYDQRLRLARLAGTRLNQFGFFSVKLLNSELAGKDWKIDPLGNKKKRSFIAYEPAKFPDAETDPSVFFAPGKGEIEALKERVISATLDDLVVALVDRGLLSAGEEAK